MIKNKNTGHLDGSVITSMVALIVLAGGLLSYRYYTYTPCQNVVFSVSDINPKVGETVDFLDHSVGVDRWEWNFGDNTSVSRNSSPTHIYSESGDYIVKLTINGTCTEYKNITIAKPAPIIDNTLIPDFNAPTRVRVGEKVNFRDQTDGASKWEWRFGETGKVDAKTKNPSYRFTKSGRFTVTLVVDGDLKYLAKKTVTVIPKEKEKVKTFRYQPKAKQEIYIPDSPEEYVSYEKPAKESKPISKPVASDEELVLLLTEYASGKKKASELVPYFCDGNQTVMVKANGNLMRLSDLLAKIKGKDIRVKNLYTFREQDQCIQRFEMKYSKKGVF